MVPGGIPVHPARATAVHPLPAPLLFGVGEPEPHALAVAHHAHQHLLLLGAAQRREVPSARRALLLRLLPPDLALEDGEALPVVGHAVACHFDAAVVPDEARVAVADPCRVLAHAVPSTRPSAPPAIRVLHDVAVPDHPPAHRSFLSLRRPPWLQYCEALLPPLHRTERRLVPRVRTAFGSS
eukprot:3011049-Rhodomonas_salina.2